MIVYPVGVSGQSLVLTEPVLAHFWSHRQRRRDQREAGGQLFATFEGSRILIEEATGPRATDGRTRISYVPDRRAEQQEIDLRHARGMHYVGDWHTHPERFPSPSPPDVASIAECFASSSHQLNGFVLIVVGQAAAPNGLSISIHDAQSMIVLPPCADATY